MQVPQILAGKVPNVDTKPEFAIVQLSQKARGCEGVADFIRAPEQSQLFDRPALARDDKLVIGERSVEILENTPILRDAGDINFPLRFAIERASSLTDG